MGKITSMILAAAAKQGTTTAPGWVAAFQKAISNLIGPILIVASSAGIIYAIWVGIKFVRAEDKSARDEAKHKLIYVIIGIVVTLVLIGLFYWLADYLKNGLPAEITDLGNT